MAPLSNYEKGRLMAWDNVFMTIVALIMIGLLVWFVLGPSGVINLFS